MAPPDARSAPSPDMRLTCASHAHGTTGDHDPRRTIVLAVDERTRLRTCTACGRAANPVSDSDEGALPEDARAHAHDRRPLGDGVRHVGGHAH